MEGIKRNKDEHHEMIKESIHPEGIMRMKLNSRASSYIKEFLTNLMGDIDLKIIGMGDPPHYNQPTDP